MNIRNAIMACALLGMGGCSSLAPDRESCDADQVAAVFTKTAAYVYSPDFIGYNEPLSDTFSPADLRILRDHRASVESMVETALGLQDSVWGAKLAAQFRLRKVLPLLQAHFMTPRHCYMGEGPDYTKLESFLMDDQYVYSVAYLEAIEVLSGKSVDKVLHLTPSEVEQLAKYAGDEDSEFHHWALWMQRKLKMTKGPDLVPGDAARKPADPPR